MIIKRLLLIKKILYNISCIKGKNLTPNMLYEETVNDGLQAKSKSPPVFVNKDLLEESHTHSFTYFLWLLRTMMIEMSTCDTDCVACNTCNIYFLGLYRKGLLTHALCRDILQ